MTFLNYLFLSLRNGFGLMVLGLLPYIILAFFMQYISDLLRRGMGHGSSGKFWLYFTSPGVMLHELGHVLFCLIFKHQIVEVKLFENDERRNRLGYVNHRYNPKSYYQRVGNFFIGTGPIWFGVACMFVLSKLLLPSGMIGAGDGFSDIMMNFFGGFLKKEFWFSWKTWIWFYLSFSIAAHVKLSKADLEGAKDGAIFLVGVVFLGSLLLGWCGSWEDALLNFEIAVFVTLLSMMISFLVLIVIPVCIIRHFLYR